MKLSQETIEKIKKHPGWSTLRDYLVGSITELNSIENLSEEEMKDIPNEEVGQYVKARRMAAEKIYEILDPILRGREEEDFDQIKKTKEKSGL